MTPHEQTAVDLLDAETERHDASGVWSLLSGGDDSLATALVTSQAKRFRGCLHIDTGIGIPETQDFVRETCARQGWPLKVYRAMDYGQDYDALVLAHGFPGPALHYKMYQRLKERALRVFIREHKTRRRDRLILSTGVRQSESERRMGHAVQVSREGLKVWANPLFLATKFDCLDIIMAARVPRSPVVELIHKSGECLCGSFAKPDELKEIALWFPTTAARIRALEARVKAAGQRACVWGVRPARERKRQPAIRDSAGRRVGPLCQQCELNYAAE
jgi:3'-phosphoadenosine 5'-phosphosulfate sulfotransferase (PAPS reductase)/FAD synthetase